ncbi:MAG: hypothetical protein LBP79_05950, partial [Clostridiales bacterium]|nr:hypothetical protein [Clostridiales bacterium]
MILFAGVPVASLYFIADELSEGNHTVRVVDLARNATEKSFTVDLAAPELVIMKNSAATQDGTHLKAGDTFSIQVSDTYLAAVFFDGEPTSTRLCNADNLDECAHIIVVSDLAGNRSEAKFTVDKTAPSFSLNAYYLVGETIVLDIDEVNGYTVFLDGIETPNLTFFANDLSEALHTVTVIDLARNSAARTFTVDLSAPVLTLSGFSLDGQAELLDDGGFFTFVSPKSKDSFSNWICRHRYICLAFCMMPHRLPIVI